MKILHIATLITPDGAYGGPVRVATNLVKEIHSSGHDAEFIAAGSGFDDGFPTVFDGVSVTLFNAHRTIPGIGFAGISAPRMIKWLHENARRFDVVHIHAARDLVTLPAGIVVALRGVPFVLQTHGMIDPSPRLSANVLDRLATKRLLRRAGAVFYLTETERAGLLEVGAKHESLEFLPNGVPDNGPGISADSPSLRVLYLARLQARKRPELFVEMAAALHAKYPQHVFELVGPDEGAGAAVESAIARHNAGAYVKWLGPISPEQTLSVMRGKDLFVLPSINEPFPMAVLEAMSVGCPVVVSSSCGLAPYVEQYGAGEVFDESLDDLIQVVDGLLGDEFKRSTMAKAATIAVSQRFNMGSVVAQLNRTYEKVGSA
ncbi:glycosyltransferase [Arthrobacter ginkgonis]|uniref:Glycosyltransferase n=1 Tax=Arthrobacter ginkgonis TaxID=1630594 RepID=A0ABP7C0D2_9MICC